VNMGEAVVTCLRKYSDFTGRARRSEYWWFVLAEFLVGILVFAAFLYSLRPAIEPMWDDIKAGRIRTLNQFIEGGDWEKVTGALFAFGAIAIIMTIPMYAAGARRLHDMGQSGLWLLLNFAYVIPFASFVPLIMCMIDGQDHENRWGPDPKAGERVGWGNVPPEPYGPPS